MSNNMSSSDKFLVFMSYLPQDLSTQVVFSAFSMSPAKMAEAVRTVTIATTLRKIEEKNNQKDKTSVIMHIDEYSKITAKYSKENADYFANKTNLINASKSDDSDMYYDENDDDDDDDDDDFGL